MKILSRIFIAIVLLVGYHYLPSKVESRCHKYIHHIKVPSAGVCGATAIAPHALLTAAHCHPDMTISFLDFLEGKNPKKTNNGILIDQTNAEVVDSIYDGNDHVILLVKGITFSDYAKFSDSILEQGNSFFYFGEAAGNWNYLRHGYVMSIDNTEDGNIAALDVNGFYGDSGSAIFNWKGQIVGTLNFIHTWDSPSSRDEDPSTFKVLAAPDFKFRQSNIDYAKRF